MRFTVVSLALLFAACPKPPATGEGEGEGEGAGEGEGEGVGAGEGEGSVDPGTNIVTGSGFNLEDVTGDGVTLAFRDNNNALNEVAVAGGSPSAVPTTVHATDKAEYHGGFLVAYHGFADATQKVANSAEVRDGAGAISTLGNNIKISSVKASPDGAHLFHEESAGTVSDGNGGTTGIEDLILDGTNLLADVSPNHAEKEKLHFSPSGASFLVGAKIVDGTGTTQDHIVRVYPVGGGAFTSIASDLATDPLRQGPSTQNQFSPDENTVFFGAGKNSNVITIMASNATATGEPVQLRAGADQQSFKISLDGTRLIYLVDTVTSGAIESIAFTGGTPTVIRPGGVSKALDLGTLTTNHIVYATAIDAVTGNESLSVIGLDSSGEVALGDQGVDEGSTPDGRFIVARINVNGGVGDLVVLDTTSSSGPTTQGSGVKKVSIASNTEYVSLDSLGTLRVGHFSGGSSQIATGVDHFVLVNDSATSTTASKVAYSRSADGIWVAGLPQ